MEYVIVLLLVYLIFKDDIREEINYHKSKRVKPEKTEAEMKQEKRKEEFEHELNNIMDYSMDTAINSRKAGDTDGR